MPSRVIIADYYRVPGGSAPVRRVQDELIRIDTEERAGVVYDSERRLQWNTAGPAEFMDRIASEQALWDDWADDELEQLETIVPLPVESRAHDWWDTPLYTDPGIARTIDETPELTNLAGRRLLDIGGSIKDSFRFVWNGDVAHVDQVDVSGRSQRFGHKKTEARFAHMPELAERFVFHTAAAEALPFADDSFDVVFSRATIHHTSRPSVFAEIRRVLRPNGIFWMIEPRLVAPLYVLMRISRKIRRVDRGTDDPLRNAELRRLGEMMSIERLYGIGLLSRYGKFFGAGRRLRGKLDEMDRSIVQGYFGRRLAHTISLVARKAG